MGWSLDHQNLRSPEQLNEYLLCLGKAVSLASLFEGKCQYILRLRYLAYYIETGKDIDAAFELGRLMKDKLLHRTLGDLKEFPDFKQKDIDILDRSREARNSIIHECAKIGLGTRPKMVQEQFELLKKEVKFFIPGDNLISRWIYEIEEKEGAPKSIVEAYPLLVEKWIFGSFESRE